MKHAIKELLIAVAQAGALLGGAVLVASDHTSVSRWILGSLIVITTWNWVEFRAERRGWKSGYDLGWKLRGYEADLLALRHAERVNNTAWTFGTYPPPDPETIAAVSQALDRTRAENRGPDGA